MGTGTWGIAAVIPKYLRLRFGNGGNSQAGGDNPTPNPQPDPQPNPQPNSGGDDDEPDQ